MIIRASSLAVGLPATEENVAATASAGVTPIPHPRASLYRRKSLAANLMEVVLTGLAGTLMVGCVIFGFLPKTRLVDVYLFPATYSGPIFDKMLMLHQGHPLIRGSAHQISVMLSIVFCLLFWTVVFGAAFRLANARLSKPRCR